MASLEHGGSDAAPIKQKDDFDDTNIMVAPRLFVTREEDGSEVSGDAAQLANLGYKQELQRNFSFFGYVSLSLALMALPQSILSTITYGIVAGGPAALLYNWLAVAFAITCLSLSMAEICSKYPTAGSCYFWSAMLAPQGSAPLLSWITGWLNYIGELTGVASIGFSLSAFIFTLVIIFYPEFEPKSYQIVLLYWVFLCIFFLANSSGKHLSMMNLIAAGWNGFSLIVILVVLLATCASEDRRDAHFVFTGFDPSFSGYPGGWSWFLNSLMPTFCLLVAGNATTLVEEVPNPSKQVPKAMIIPVVLGAIVGFSWLIGILFVLPDEATLLSVPTGQPAPVIFYLVTRSKTATACLTVLLVGCGTFCGIAASTCLSRFTYGFSRDGALPGSAFLSKIHPRQAVPINALLTQNILCALLGLIYIGSSAAFNALLGCAVACLLLSYSIPICVNLLAGRRHTEGAPFSLGKAGYVINVIAITWSLLMIVISSFPLVNHPTLATMNYASVVFVGFGAISLLWYVIWGRKHFLGPELSRTAFH